MVAQCVPPPAAGRRADAAGLPPEPVRSLAMPCIVALLALISPRLALFAVWVFSDWLDAYDSWILPVIGFFLLPWTTLAYAAMWALDTNQVRGFEWFIVILAFVADLASYMSSDRARPRD